MATAVLQAPVLEHHRLIEIKSGSGALAGDACQRYVALIDLA